MKANLYVLYNLYIKEVLIIFTGRTYIFFLFELFCDGIIKTMCFQSWKSFYSQLKCQDFIS